MREQAGGQNRCARGGLHEQTAGFRSGIVHDIHGYGWFIYRRMGSTHIPSATTSASPTAISASSSAG